MADRKLQPIESTRLYKSLPTLTHRQIVVPPLSSNGSRQVDINQEIARAEKIKNDNAEQDITLKRNTWYRLFRFLITETTVVFILAFFQAIHWPWHFHLEDWSFKLVITATIGQITTMLYVAVRYLFPKQ
ncbi:MAG: hypothetical protein ACQR33_06335 [Candidatus Saccharibacteria bacterium]